MMLWKRAKGYPRKTTAFATKVAHLAHAKDDCLLPLYPTKDETWTCPTCGRKWKVYYSSTYGTWCWVEVQG